MSELALKEWVKLSRAERGGKRFSTWREHVDCYQVDLLNEMVVHLLEAETPRLPNVSLDFLCSLSVTTRCPGKHCDLPMCWRDHWNLLSHNNVDADSQTLPSSLVREEEVFYLNLEIDAHDRHFDIVVILVISMKYRNFEPKALTWWCCLQLTLPRELN